MPKNALEKAMDLLALRPLSNCELQKKLSASGHYSREDIEEALEVCRQRGYLNDGLLASDAARYLNAGGKGRTLIRKKLRSRGIGDEELAQALEEISPEEEYEAAQNAAAGKLRLLTREKAPRKKREKLFRFLISRGFSPELVSRIVRDLLNGETEAPDLREEPEDDAP